LRTVVFVPIAVTLLPSWLLPDGFAPIIVMSILPLVVR
jgi:hypothetical protein